MGANVEALKNLYKALGGDETDVADITTNDGMINAIAEIVVPVPSPAQATDGQVLTVDDKAWTIANLPS